MLAIATGVKAHVATSGEAPADASQATLGAFVSPWPDNPFTGAPMAPGSNPGDYVYDGARRRGLRALRVPLRRDAVAGSVTGTARGRLGGRRPAAA